jgi:hypothetical protein
MADNNPLAIRASESVKALFNELAESGDFENKGEFLDRLLVIYQLESAKTDVSVMKPAIEVAQTLTARFLEVLNGTAAAILTKEEKAMQELESTKAHLEERIAELERGRDEDAERIQTLCAENIEHLSKIMHLESVVSDKDALLKAHNESAATQSRLDSLLSLLEAQGINLQSSKTA